LFVFRTPHIYSIFGKFFPDADKELVDPCLPVVVLDKGRDRPGIDVCMPRPIDQGNKFIGTDRKSVV
jgi:hypothetical protein